MLASGVVAVVQLAAGMGVKRSLMQKRQVDRKEWETGQEEEVDDRVPRLEAREDGECKSPSDMPHPAADPVTASPLLQDSSSTTSHPKREQTIRSLLSSPTIRPQVLLVAFALITQQFAGINAVLFYSTPVLKSLLPDKSGLIGIFVSAINVGMTVPSLVLIDVSRPEQVPLHASSSYPRAENREETPPSMFARRHGHLSDPPRDRTKRTPPNPLQYIDHHLCGRFRARPRADTVLVDK